MNEKEYWQNEENQFRLRSVSLSEDGSVRELVRVICEAEKNIELMANTINCPNRTSSPAFQAWTNELILGCFDRIRTKMKAKK